MAFVLLERWKIHEKIGSGSFGEVFSAEDLETGADVAVKRELINPKHTAYIFNEYECYKTLGDADGFPKVLYCGSIDQYNVIVMTMLGPDLRFLLKRSRSGTLPIKTVFYCIPRMIQRLQYIHSQGIVFRDVKPDQFCIGRSGENGHIGPIIYMIDFGLATRYMHDGRHIPERKHAKNRPKTGTARYASVNVHLGYDHTRRDDLESLAYVAVELAKGSLPWAGINALSSVQGWRKVGNIKNEVLIADLCQDLPDAFSQFLEYARNLGFDEEPDYGRLMRLFTDFYDSNWKDDVLFWE
ncbi:casein kinase I epsilon/delta kin-20B [Polychytrium aggregatum]|uniref:casein kinase I epsilon/delta kin-20B n=1 Tax=Polychytrium aggregatum TaxID=110093 RepID=UPI0022FDE532|nr:casein kinase I epsilon/delta kin-20B [Polychytrium aggregatum]KAI9202725.1 casein kinase I epsilon/delta kin-20B [Polychytrium aggregatum]